MSTKELEGLLGFGAVNTREKDEVEKVCSEFDM